MTKAQIIPHLINLGHLFVRPLLDMVQSVADLNTTRSRVPSAALVMGMGQKERMGIWRDLQRFLPSKEIWPPSLAGEARKIRGGDRCAGEQITGDWYCTCMRRR
jgi:hypothetical protein